MKVTVGNIEYRISFYHGWKETKGKKLNKRATYCTIEENDCGEKRYLTDSIACAYEDQFSKPEGRKRSLIKTVAKLSPVKSIRFAFWQAYWAERAKVTKKKWVA